MGCRDAGLRAKNLEAELRGAYRLLERRAEGLEAELRAVYRLLEERRADLARCPAHPGGGERCCLPAGHGGGHLWLKS